MSYLGRNIDIVSDIAVANEPGLATLDSNSYIKKYINYDESNADDIAMYKKLCTAARQQIERLTGRSLAEKKIKVLIDEDDLENNQYVLPYMPHKAYASADFKVYSVNYAGTETELEKDTGFYLWGNTVNSITIELPTVLSTTVGVTGHADQYLIQYICGYGVDGCPVLPEDLRLAIVKLVSEWWDNRDEHVPVVSNVSAVHELIEPYIIDVF